MRYTWDPELPLLLPATALGFPIEARLDGGPNGDGLGWGPFEYDPASNVCDIHLAPPPCPARHAALSSMSDSTDAKAPCWAPPRSREGFGSRPTGPTSTRSRSPATPPGGSPRTTAGSPE